MINTLKRTLVILFVLSVGQQGATQINFNLELVSNFDYDQLVADVWGYVGPDGTEYAVVGTFTGTSVISLADPANPEEVLFVPGAESIWRDIHNWGDKLYIVADRGADGILIVDMSQSPDTITYDFWREPFQTAAGDTVIVNRSHNLWIDEKGYLYLSGSNLNSGGVVIFEIDSDLMSPEFKGFAHPEYSHDNFVRNDTMYSADIIAGVFSVHDVTDRTAPVLLNQKETTSAFTHNCWPSDDGRYLFTTDERPNSNVDAYDVSDPNDLKYISSFRPKTTDGTGVIPHNVHYFEGFLVVSWYTDGVVIVDAHRPENMVKVAQYDTFLGDHGGFNGAWGAYPYLPSGLVLGSDRQTGLYVLEPDYTRATYLEGRVTNAETGSGITEVEINIEADVPNTNSTGINGFYKTGTAFDGTREVTFSHPEFQDLTTVVELVRGEVTELDVELVPLESIRINGVVTANGSERDPLEGARVELHSAGEMVEFINTDESGFFEFTTRPGNYDVAAGKWGYNQAAEFNIDPDNSTGLELQLDHALWDDFIVDLGWTTSSPDDQGAWQRVVPNGSSIFGEIIHPPSDAEGDLGDFAFVTGQPEDQDPLSDNPEIGTYVLTSPGVPVEYRTFVGLNFSYWFYNWTNDNSNTFSVYVIYGEEEELVYQTSETTDGWSEMATGISDVIPRAIDSFWVSVEVINETGELMAAGFDALRMELIFVNTEDEITEMDWELFPNPASNTLFLKFQSETSQGHSLIIHDRTGREVLRKEGVNNLQEVDISSLRPGLYSLSIQSPEGIKASTKNFVIAR